MYPFSEQIFLLNNCTSVNIWHLISALANLSITHPFEINLQISDFDYSLFSIVNNRFQNLVSRPTYWLVIQIQDQYGFNSLERCQMELKSAVSTFKFDMF